MRKLPGSRAVAGRFGTTFVQLRYRVASDEAAAAARREVLAALDRLEAELDAAGGEYLVGDAFSVADLTAGAAVLPARRPARGAADACRTSRRPGSRRSARRSPTGPATGGSRRCSAGTASRPPPPPPASAPPDRSGDLDDRLDLDRDVERKLGGADRRAGVAAGGIAPDLEHEVGEPVDHGRRLVEAGGALDEAERLDPAVTRSRSPSSCSSEAKIESPVSRAAS